MSELELELDLELVLELEFDIVLELELDIDDELALLDCFESFEPPQAVNARRLNVRKIRE